VGVSKSIAIPRVGSEEEDAGTGVGGTNVHIPTRLWQSTQCNIVFSAFFASSLIVERGDANEEAKEGLPSVNEGRRMGVEGPAPAPAPAPRRLGVDGAEGTGVLSLVLGSDDNEGEPRIDPTRDDDEILERSTGAAGGAGDQPKRATTTAVSVGSMRGISLSAGEGEGGAPSTAGNCGTGGGFKAIDLRTVCTAEM
jgi:hypothetical protein